MSETPRTVPARIAARAESSGEAPALLADGRAPLSHRALARLVADISSDLAALGVGRRDRVATVLPNGPEAAASFLAIAGAATCAPLNPAYREAELAFFLSDLAPKALVIEAGDDGPARAVAERAGIAVLALERGDAAGAFRLAGGRDAAEARSAGVGARADGPARDAGSAEPGGATRVAGAAEPDGATRDAGAAEPGGATRDVASDGKGGGRLAGSADGRTQPTRRLPAGGAREDDVALVLHTSGTTSRPKLVPLTHASLCRSAASVAAVLRLGPEDRCLNVMPLFHIHGLVAALLASLEAGASVVCTPGFHAPSFLEALERHEASWYTAVPTIHQAVAARAATAPRALPRLRFARSSSAPLPARVARELERSLGVPVIEAYGMTEAAHQVASNPLPPGERKLGSVGRAAGPEVAILDDDGSPLPPGAVGEVSIRGASVFTGYEANPDANRAAFTGGWFRTGDEGHLDADGYLFLRGRRKEIINRGGEKIAPGEVEDALLAHAAVAQAVAFSLPDDRLGEEVGAAVVLRDGAAASELELQRFTGERLADFKVPRRIAVLDEIPKGATGKLQRIGMAERLGLAAARTAGPSAAAGAASRPPTPAEERLIALWREILGVAEVRVDDDFFALGGDSLRAAELVGRLRESGAPNLSLTALVWAPTVAGLAAEIEQSATSGAALVPLRRGGDRPPLFVVHALDGEVVRFGALARSLAPGRPFYAFKALGVEEQAPRHERLEEMAAHYLKELRAVQPRGPYQIGALCMGAGVAVEMARALLAEGEAVAPLLFIDPHVPEKRTPWTTARRFLARTRLLPARLRRRIGTDPNQNLRTPFLRRMARIRDAWAMAPYPGRATVILSDEHAALGWLSQVEGGATVHEIGGPHMELLRHPRVDRLAALLDATLDQALEAGAALDQVPLAGEGLGRAPDGGAAPERSPRAGAARAS